MSRAAYLGPRDDIDNEIQELEARLAQAKTRRAASSGSSRHGAEGTQPPLGGGSLSPGAVSAHHYLLLLSDSALPLGSFAFSSGLESYLAHARDSSHRPSFLAYFLPLSLSSYASTTLPFVLAAHRDPGAVAELDDYLDAAIICTVGRRASTAQGRALLSIWDRSFTGSVPAETAAVLKPFAALLRSANSSATANGAAGEQQPPPVAAHLGPLFGAIAALLGLTLHQTAYVFLLSHVKALVSAAVRASMFGPYQAQKVLASNEVQSMITTMIEREWNTPYEDAGQMVPVMDLWIGRHEMLYSRIFNS